MAGLSSGHGIQVVTPTEEHTFTLDEEGVSRLLLDDEIHDLPVVVISVAGAYRKGKSFLLNFFLRYLQHTYVEHKEEGRWLGAQDEPLIGFSWRSGSERNTTGLLLWSQAFKASLPNGEKVAILLMDTQGTFDSQSTVKDNAVVFALSTMLSSVQIYNLSQNIEEDDLQHLELFTEYGRLALQHNRGKPFQRLQLLVRDWSFPYDYPYGAVGGQRLLDKRLEIKEDQHEELQALRRHISSCFEELTCFLMPHPGLHVATNPGVTGKRSELSPEFDKHLQELVPMLLAQENLVPKRIEGQKIKARDLLFYFKAYMNVFKGSELPEPKTILEATAEANNLSALAEARDVYDKLMEEVAGGARPYVPDVRLAAEHARARDKALHAFHATRKMGGEDFANTYKDRLLKEIEEQFEQLRAHNESKNILRMMSTPLVLVLLSLLAYLLGTFADLLGVQTLSSACQVAALVLLLLLAVWSYTRLTGNLRDIGAQIDDFTSTMRDYVIQQVSNNVTNAALSTTLGAPTDKKQQ